MPYGPPKTRPVSLFLAVPLRILKLVQNPRCSLLNTFAIHLMLGSKRQKNACSEAKFRPTHESPNSSETNQQTVR